MSPASPDTAPRLGRYALLGRIATGGMGELFVAELEGAADFRKPVVIKRILPHLAFQPEFEALFFNEARIAARLSHPNVCHVYELDRVDGQYYMAMEYLEGASLDELCDEVATGRLADDWSIPLVVSLVYQFCEGLHHVHELTAADGEPLGIVHRDISTSNLFVTRDGVGKVLDFGIAKIRAAASRTASTLKGKFAYMSPEQLCSEPLDRRSDVFSLAVVLFEALTGRMMFDQKSEALVALAIMDGETLLPGAIRKDVPPALDRAMERALAKLPEQRFASAREFGEALIDSVGGAAIPTGRIAKALAPAIAPHLARRRAILEAWPEPTFAPGLIIPAGDTPGAPPIGGEPMASLARVEQVRRPDGAALPQAPPSPAAVPVWSRRRWWSAVVGLSFAFVAAAVGAWAMTRPGPVDESREAISAGVVAEAPAPAPPPDAGAVQGATMSHDAAPAGAPLAASHDAGSGRPRAARRQRTSVRETGYLSIGSTPYATIWVDGRKIGDTPIYKFELPSGRHNVRAVAGDRSRSERITVSPGKVTTHRIRW